MSFLVLVKFDGMNETTIPLEETVWPHLMFLLRDGVYEYITGDSDILGRE
jgi:hypothetical protein